MSQQWKSRPVALSSCCSPAASSSTWCSAEIRLVQGHEKGKERSRRGNETNARAAPARGAHRVQEKHPCLLFLPLPYRSGVERVAKGRAGVYTLWRLILSCGGCEGCGGCRLRVSAGGGPLTKKEEVFVLFPLYQSLLQWNQRERLTRPWRMCSRTRRGPRCRACRPWPLCLQRVLAAVANFSSDLSVDR
jgi:hypothetical protein